MKSLFLTHSNGEGGAARAANRLFEALTDHTNIDLRMHVDFKQGDDPRVFTNRGIAAEQKRYFRIHADEVPAYLARHPNPGLYSPGRSSALSARKIDSFGADVLNIHWTNFGYLSIEQIGRLRTPFVWTLHDMWAVTGGMNYEPDSLSQNTDNYSGIEKWVVSRKKKHWKQSMHVVTPSNWLADIVRNSEIGCSWAVSTIPNPLDLETFKPLPKKNNAGDAHIILVSLGGDLTDSRKGFDLLMEALMKVESKIELHVLGHVDPPNDWPHGMPPTRWLGYLNSKELATAYAEADIAVIPSRQDNLPQTATEPVACGVPVVAFDIGGLPDIVDHGVTGLLARPNDPTDLAAHIDAILTNDTMRGSMRIESRKRAERLWHPKVIALAYQEVFKVASTNGVRQLRDS